MKRQLEEVKNAKSIKENNNEEGGELNKSMTEKENDESVPGPSSKKKRKRTSPVWNHFSVKVSEVDNKSEYAHCHYCDK